MIVQKLLVDVGETLHEEMEHLRKSLSSDNWAFKELTIVPFQGNIGGFEDDDFMLSLKQKYKLRQPDEMSSTVMSPFIKKDNYITMMHDLLYMEETCQLQQISRYILHNIVI